MIFQESVFFRQDFENGHDVAESIVLELLLVGLPVQHFEFRVDVQRQVLGTSEVHCLPSLVLNQVVREHPGQVVFEHVFQIEVSIENVQDIVVFLIDSDQLFNKILPFLDFSFYRNSLVSEVFIVDLLNWVERNSQNSLIDIPKSLKLFFELVSALLSSGVVRLQVLLEPISFLDTICKILDYQKK